MICLIIIFSGWIVFATLEALALMRAASRKMPTPPQSSIVTRKS